MEYEYDNNRYGYKKYNKVYLTEDGLFRGQHDGSAAPINTSYDRIMEAAQDYWNSQKWE